MSVTKEEKEEITKEIISNLSMEFSQGKQTNSRSSSPIELRLFYGRDPDNRIEIAVADLPSYYIDEIIDVNNRDRESDY